MRKRDVTSSVNEYRECVRHLWNMHFRPRCPPINREGVAFGLRFDAIAEALFREIVLAEIDQEHYVRASKSDPWPFLRIAPAAPAKEFSALVGTPGANGGDCWELTDRRFGKKGDDLRLIDLDDWNQWDWIDLQYYRAAIIGCSDRELIGKRVMIETRKVRVLFDG